MKAIIELLRALLFVPVFLVAFVIMLPALIESRVPVELWPAYVLYALLH